MNRGVTIIELLIVVAIVLTLGIMSVSFYSRFLTQNAVDNTVTKLVQSFRKAQVYSMTGRQNGVWGVKYVSTSTPPPTPTPTIPPPLGTVVQQSVAACGADCQVYTLGVTCQNLPERTIYLEERGLGNNGAIFFALGGYGTTYYRDDIPAYTRSQGFQTYRIRWGGPYGWGTGTGGAGYRKAMCGFSDVVKWVRDNNIARNSDVMCATGNSGGSFQISYGLSDYGLGDYLDMVIPTGGPVGRWDVGCFDSSSPGYFPATLAGRYLTDYMFGYTLDPSQTTGPCGTGDGSNPDVVTRFQDESLVSPLVNRIYSFPGTKVNFVESVQDSTNVYTLARFYYDAISSQKSWYDIPGTEHEVYLVPEASAIMQGLFVNECIASPTPTPTPPPPPAGPPKIVLYLTGNSAFDESFNVNDNITINGFTTDISFAKATGIRLPSVPDTITITVSGNNSTKTVTINSQGVVSKN